MTRVRLGAVGYLNARPLVHRLDHEPRLFDVRFDAPSTCAALLHDGAIDVGMIPSIEYLRGAEPYRIVPDLGIVSHGAVASVALFSRVPLASVRRIGLDTSSRTSAALTRILCAESWHIAPAFEDISPSAVDVALETCDAVLLIGDPALFLDYRAAALTKIDLGDEWTRLTGLPFVWAFWAGRPRALGSADVRRLQAARDEGVAESDLIADDYCGAARAALCRAYLRDNIKYRLAAPEITGLTRYYELAARYGLVDIVKPVEFFQV